MAASLVVAGAAQADDAGIKPLDIKRGRCRRRWWRWPTAPRSRRCSSARRTGRKKRAPVCCGWIPTPRRSRRRSLQVKASAWR
ncbi:hypothetical protein M8494_35875 [Serratia ureilytica]